MLPIDTASYREYVLSRMDRFRRTAYLLCGDWHTADDLVSIVLGKLYRRWRKAQEIADLDAYARRMLLRAWLDERRRPWRREHTTNVLPDRAATAAGRSDDLGAVTDRIALLALLAELPPRRRAVVVLRYYCDLSVEETASALGVSTGTVKSQAARALETLRTRLVAASTGAAAES